jgi:hypothetical protein
VGVILALLLRVQKKSRSLVPQLQRMPFFVGENWE